MAELTVPYSDSQLLSMLAFIAQHMTDYSPLARKYGGYVYFFATSAIATQYDQLIDSSPTTAIALASFSFKEGNAQTMNISLNTPSTNNVQLNSTGNVIEFTFATQDGSQIINEPVTVNYVIECEGVTQNVQDNYSAGTTVSFNIDDYLNEGTNTITITVRGDNTKVMSTVVVTFVVKELSVETDFNVATARSANEDMTIRYLVNGTADDNGAVTVEFYSDGVHLTSEDIAVRQSDLGNYLNTSIPASGSYGLHWLQVRCYATIGGVQKYSRIWYYEYVVTSNNIARYTTIKRQLPQGANIITNRGNLTLQCQQYVQESIVWGFWTYNSGEEATVTWTLTKSGSSQTVGSEEISGAISAQANGVEHTMQFMPAESGDYQLVATIKASNTTSTQIYNVSVTANASNIAEATDSMLVRLLALGRKNSEDSSLINVWTYNTVTTTFTDMSWNTNSGWDNNALVLSGGAKATINCTPFASMGSTSAGCTVEVEFETFNIKDESAVIFSVGNRIKITGNTATLTSTNGTSITDKFPTNTRLKLAFVVHPKQYATGNQNLLMEIINNGVTSRVVNYASTDSFTDTVNKIVIGGTSNAGIRIYTVRAYTTDLSNLKELNNVMVDSTNMSTIVTNNDIYTNSELDIQKIRNKVPCLAITGHGGTDVLQTIWDATQSKPTIFVDAEWTNPNAKETNWKCVDMRLRSHGQSTLRNPMKSLKMWFKDGGVGGHETKFYRTGIANTTDDTNGVEDTTSDHRWSMKVGSMPQNKFVAQCYYIDSSNCKSPALLNLINSSMYAAGYLTAPQKYARDTWPTVMGNTFPYTLRITPDSIGAVVIARDDDSSAWTYQGIFVLMDDKKSDYLYGERSQYKVSASDPFCFSNTKDDSKIAWDNAPVTRFEFLQNNGPIADMKTPSRLADGTASNQFYGPQMPFTSEDEEDVSSDGEGSDSEGTTSTSYDFEQYLEIIYPDYDDFYKKDGTFNNTKYRVHTEKLRKFMLWVATCWADDNGAKTYTKFNDELTDHLDLDFWAAYYVIAMTNGCFDSLVRNLQLTTYETKESSDGNTYEIWLPLWWDIDIQDGTINTGQLAFDPPVSRQTVSTDYGTAFRGSSNALWDMLEASSTFVQRCRTVLSNLYDNGYTLEALWNLQDSYVNTWNESLYNESQMTKYKQMYLSDPSNKSAFLSYCLGDGKTFRRYWMKKNWDYWMSRLAAGSFAKNGFTMRILDSSSGQFKVTYGEQTYFGWMLGDNPQMVDGAYSKLVEADSEQVKTASLTNSINLTIFQSPYMKKLDVSAFGGVLAQIDFTACYDSVIGSLMEELYFGIAEPVANGARNGSNVGITGLNMLTNLQKLQMQGFTAYNNLDISSLANLTHIYLKGSAMTGISFAKSLILAVSELPDTIMQLSMEAVTFSTAPVFYDPTTLATSIFPKSCNSMSLLSMGGSSIVKAMVLAWIQYNKDNDTVSDCSLTLTGIDWVCTIDELKLLGEIPMANRYLSGTVYVDETLDNDSISAFSAMFKDDSKNINPFSATSAFKINSGSGFVLSAPSSTLQGNSFTIAAQVFPITESTGYTYTFYISKITINGNDQNISTLADYSTGSQQFNGVTLITIGDNAGNVTTTENGAEDMIFTVHCKAQGTAKSYEGDTTFTIAKRTYPEITLSGSKEISTIGELNYTTVFTPSDYTGTRLLHTWTITGGVATIASQTESHAVVNVGQFTDDTSFILRYASTWKDGVSRSASISVNVIYEPTMVVFYRVDNVNVFDLLFTYYTSNFGTASSTNSFQRQELYKFTSIPTTLQNNTSITDFSQIQYMRKLTSVDLSGDTNLTGTMNMSGLTLATSINISGSKASAQVGPESGSNTMLTSLHLGTPKSIQIKNCTNLNITETED